MKNKNRSVRRLSKFSLATLIAVYVLILVGGIVRSTGSGMGCPDWPKCFGQWVPPTEADELPSNYQEIYSAKRHEKNIRFAKYLSVLGFDKTADQLLTDESIRVEAEFNKYKTWTEYFNRLVGVLIGLFIIATFLYSIPFLKTNKTIFFIALATLLLVIFQGWIGSIVVSTNLVPWMVTLHMSIALLIVALLVYIVFKTRFTKNTTQTKISKSVIWSIVTCMVLLLIQISLGTQVRESIDEVAASMDYAARGTWVENLGLTFLIHRSFSWAILIAHAVMIYLVVKQGFKSGIVSLLGGVILLSIATGIILNYFGFPAAIQPVHLLLGTAAFGIQFLLFLQLRAKRTQTVEVRS